MSLTSYFGDAALRLPRAFKRLIAITADLTLCGMTVWIALYLRLETWVAPTIGYTFAVIMAAVIAIPTFFRFQLYASIFRFTGWNAMLLVARASAVFGMFYALIFTFWGVPGVPRTIGIIQPILLFVGVSASRLFIRWTLGDLYRGVLTRGTLPGVLIYGAGSAGRQLASALIHSRDHRLLGFIDDDPVVQGRTVDSVPIFRPTQLHEIVPRLKVTDVLLAMPSLPRRERTRIVETLRGLPVHVRTLPDLRELASGQVSLGDIHELDVADLLGRDPVEPDMDLLSKNLAGKTVLVTGAGGSIGSELCRQIASCNPRTLLMLDISEHALYLITQELEILKGQKSNIQVHLIPLLGSVADGRRVQEVMRTWRPDAVYHAAAYKHVPLVEHNMLEGIHNNVWGTLICAQAALSNGVAKFVLVSTDKAVRPTNVMGASKRLSEMILQALANANIDSPTCFTMVRFGNVLGSSGSVVPLFRQQIAQGGPITLTHADITRYFMTIPEASQLVIQAGTMATGADVFVLDMGEPIKIIDLAYRMVELCGLRVKDEKYQHGEIQIEITGLRPGEKLYEELLIDAQAESTGHSRIMKAHEDFIPWITLSPRLETLATCIALADHAAVRSILEGLVSGYRPQGQLVDWVYLAPNVREEFSSNISSANV